MRRPTAIDRDIADYVRKLPFGEHQISVERDFEPQLKQEGSLTIFDDTKRIVIIQSRLTP